MVTESETHACQTERVTLNDAEIERASEGGRREGLTERKEQQDRRVTDTRQGRAGHTQGRVLHATREASPPWLYYSV